jgi:hypothetical protein
MKTYKLMLYAAVCSVLIFSACSRYGNDLSYVEYGKINVQLTDAPFPYDYVSEANITIFKIDARLESDSNDAEEESNFITLFEGELSVNFLELTNGKTLPLEEAEVPVGSYNMVRVYVSEGNVLLTDGQVINLKVPSGEQTGIKILIKPALEVVTNLSSDLLLDFDISRSFIPLGNTNSVDGVTGFNFKPVIRASNLSYAGTLSGSVITTVEEETTAIEGAQINVFSKGELVTTTFTDAFGNYTVLGLDEGDYDIMIEAMGYTSETIENVTIVAANEIDLDFELVAN